MVLDFKVFTGIAKPEEIEMYKKENMNEVEQAIAGPEGGDAE